MMLHRFPSDVLINGWPYMVARNRTIYKKPANASDPLKELLNESYEPLYVAQTVFPFVFFPDKVIIRLNHVDVVQGIFFGSATSTRLQVADLRQVDVQFNPIFATLEIIPLGPLEQTMRVRFLWKEHAKKARRIIAGLMESQRKNVDFSRYETRELLTALEALGKAKE